MRARRTELAVSALVFATVFLTELGSEISPDLWWQLVSGETIVADGFTATDPVTWTSAGGEWQAHGWLSHVLLFGLSEWLGLGALLPIVAVLMALTWTGVFVASPGNPLGRAVVVLVGAAAASPLTSADSRTLSFVMLGAVVTIVELVGRGRWPRLAGWAVAPVLVLWANLDTWYLVGVGYVLVRSLADRASGRRDNESDRQGAVLGAGLVGVAGTVINPWTVDGPPAAIQRLIEAPRSLIVGLQSPDFQQQAVWPWLLFVGVIVLGMAFRGRPGVPHVLVFFAFLVPAMMSYEYVAVHALVGAPVGAAVLASNRFDRAPDSLVFVAALAVAAWSFPIASEAAAAWDEGTPAMYPAAAIDQIFALQLADRTVFNELAWGGYLAWAGIDAFVDTRYSYQPDGFVSSAVDAANALPAWGDLDEQWQPGLVIVRSDRGLVQLLDEDPGWTRVFRDATAAVFERTPS